MNQYDFYGRLSKTFPSQINVDVTNVCNLACIHCPHPEIARKPDYKPEYLHTDLNAKMVDEVREFGEESTQYIRYTGGEPLLHPQIIDILKYAVSNCAASIALTTNGTFLNKEIRGELIDMQLSLIDISIDAYTREIYKLIRKNENFDLVCSNVKHLIRQKKERSGNTKIVVSFVEQSLNAHEGQAFKKYWEDNGADYVVIRRLHSAGGYNQETASVIKASNVLRRPCLYPWERIVLKENGFLTFCPVNLGSMSKTFDYNTIFIKEAWSSSLYESLRQAHRDNDFSSRQSICARCPDWAQTRWPDEGRSYADMVNEFRDTRL